MQEQSFMSANRVCEMCPASLAGEPEYYNACSDCFPAWAENNMRECKKCGRKKIRKEEPRWKTHCGGCYKAGAEEPFRVCEGCQQPNIHPYSNQWRKLCSACYAQKKKKM